jgi:hypothetical protein
MVELRIESLDPRSWRMGDGRVSADRWRDTRADDLSGHDLKRAYRFAFLGSGGSSVISPVRSRVYATHPRSVHIRPMINFRAFGGGESARVFLGVGRMTPSLTAGTQSETGNRWQRIGPFQAGSRALHASIVASGCHRWAA